MKSSNPVFSRRGFGRADGLPQDDEPARHGAPPRHLVGAGAPGAASRGHASYATAPADPFRKVPHDPGTAWEAGSGGWQAAGTGTWQGGTAGPEGTVVRAGAMTIDDVVTRTALTLGTVALAAALSWLLLPVDPQGLLRSYGIAVGAGLAAVVLSLVQTFRRRPSPALILGYAACEGVFLGVFSSAVSTYIAPGAVVQAVLGTMAVLAGVLVAYRLRWIRVTRRFTGFVLAAGAGFVLLAAVDLVVSAFGGGAGLGLDSGATGVAFGAAGIVLGACFLALDFKGIEDGIRYGAPREEAWTAAFGLTLTLVWIYLEMLRVLSILKGDE